jgi:hypothetical protein
MVIVKFGEGWNILFTKKRFVTSSSVWFLCSDGKGEFLAKIFFVRTKKPYRRRRNKSFFGEKDIPSFTKLDDYHRMSSETSQNA